MKKENIVSSSKKRIIQCPGMVFENWSIIEQCWDGEKAYFYLNNTQSLVVRIEKCYEYPHNGLTLIPLVDDFLRKEALLLPAMPLEYDSELELFEEIRRFIHKYAEVDATIESLLASFVMLTWVYEKSPTLPIINIRGDSGTGKSRLMEILRQISYRGLKASGCLSFSSLFRTAEIWKGTICINEGDFKNTKETSNIVKYLNERYEQGGYVWRTNKDTMEQECFKAFGPTIITTRREFFDHALESRCFIIPMAERTRKNIPLNVPKRFYGEAKVLRDKLLSFRFRNFQQFEIDDTLEFDDVNPRLNQITQPISSLAKLVSQKFYEMIESIIKEMQRKIVEVSADSREGLIVIAFLKLRNEGQMMISASDISEKIMELFNIEIVPSQIGRKARTLRFESLHSSDKSKRYYELPMEIQKILVRKYIPLEEREELGLSKDSTSNSDRYKNCKIIEIEDDEPEKDSNASSRENTDGS